MSYAIRYDPERKIIHMEVQTAVNSVVATDMCLDTLKLARAHECKSVLIIFREPAVTDDTMGIYNFAKSLPALGFDPSIRVASVLPHQDPDHRFFETVAKNQGFDFHYFTDVTEAEDWLVGGRPTSNGRQKPQRTAC